MKILLISLILPFSASFKVAVIGDWGQSIDDPSRPGQEKLARAMGDYLEDHPDVQYIISTGDNIYPSGVSSVHSERFNSSWREVYFRPEYPVMSSLDWYIALGNHDHSKKNNELHQVAFSHLEPRWKLPHMWHDWLEDQGSYSIHWVIIDTEALIRKKWTPSKQLRWVESALRNSTADYLIIIGHHPIYSAGKTRGNPTIKKLIKPLMDKYKVDMYICGHDHNLQHIKKQKSRQKDHYIDYVISGGGGRTIYRKHSENLDYIKRRGYNLEAFVPQYGIVILDFSAQHVKARYYSLEKNEEMKLVHVFTHPNMNQREK